MGGDISVNELNSMQNAQGGNVNNMYVPQPAQHVCPNCGACPCCGRRNYPYNGPYIPPFNPWPGYPAPYYGDWRTATGVGTVCAN